MDLVDTSCYKPKTTYTSYTPYTQIVLALVQGVQEVQDKKCVYQSNGFPLQVSHNYLKLHLIHKDDLWSCRGDLQLPKGDHHVAKGHLQKSPDGRDKIILRARTCARTFIVAILTFYPTYPAHPTPRAKILGCRIGRMSRLFSMFFYYRAPAREKTSYWGLAPALSFSTKGPGRTSHDSCFRVSCVNFRTPAQGGRKNSHSNFYYQTL